jgi:hypothetical protein
MTSKAENEAVGCYDRMVNNLLLLELQCLGLHLSAAQALSQTWLHAIHHTRTKYSISTASYANTLDRFLFGPGQGSTLGPFLWLLHFSLMVTSLRPSTPLTRLSSVDRHITVADISEAFVDDSRVGCTSTHAYNPALSLTKNNTLSRISSIENLQMLAQQWERLLFATGGAISLDKSFWYSFSWTWSSSKPASIISNRHQENLD